MIRAATAAAVLVVAAIAAVVSFVHIEHLAVTHGQAALAAYLLPLSIDGTVAAASMVMLQAARAALAHRRGHIHHNDRPAESPESEHTSRKLRAVPLELVFTTLRTQPLAAWQDIPLSLVRKARHISGKSVAASRSLH